MKGLIYNSLSALLLATATVATPVMITAAQAQMVFRFSAPVITDSGVLGTSHFIKIAVLGMSLQDLMIALPSQMQPFQSVKVTDQTGKEIPANIAMNERNITITFAQPVVPETNLKVELSGVRIAPGTEKSLLYGITAQRVGLRGEIPVGTAIINLPER
ncbi:DUF2808 domain-containing protein [Floridanema evergladense]|uniref:DUF2808 domain-containing protein n=1 Tax=Floridaenema evergladense BLCC-F167 TaxID=3153639 RepID=A0ABV4WKJ8_9CYAN